MKKTPAFLALGILLTFASCASSDPAVSGQPVAMHRAETRLYGAGAPLSSDPSSPLNNVNARQGQLSLTAAEF